VFIVRGSSLAETEAEIRDQFSQSEHRTRIEFLGQHRGVRTVSLRPAHRDKGTGAIGQRDIPVGVFLLMIIVGAYGLDRLTGQGMVRIINVYTVALAVRSRCSLLGVLQRP
jgi:hypothetical protein